MNDEDKKQKFLGAYRERPRHDLTYKSFCKQMGTTEGQVAAWMDADESFRDAVLAINREKHYTAQNILAFNAQSLVDETVGMALGGEPKIAHQYQKLAFEIMGLIQRGGARVHVDARDKRKQVAVGNDAVEQLLDRVQMLARSFERITTARSVPADSGSPEANSSGS